MSDPFEETFCYANAEVYEATRVGAKVIAERVRDAGGDEDDFGRAMVRFLQQWHEQYPTEVWPRPAVLQ